MRVVAILALACIASCHKADRSHAIAARAPVGQARPAPKAAIGVLPLTYTLAGLPSGPQIYSDRGQCLEAMNTMAAAMDVVAIGSSTQLRCVPTLIDLVTAVNNQH